MAGKIFINYRRGDDAGHTGRLFDRLHDVFPADQLFLDVDNIAPGLDFVRVLNERVAECDVVISVIGRSWLDALDASGARRLNDPDDFVRIEIASALKQGKRVIPVLVNDAQMPRPEDLPDDLRPLARRNAVRLTHERFRSDTQGLIKALQQSLSEIEMQREAEVEAARRAKAEEERRRIEAETARRALEEELKRNAEQEAQERAAEERRRQTAEAQRRAAEELRRQETATKLRAEEDRAFAAAKRANTAHALETFLAAYPAGACAEEAHKLKAILATRENGYRRATAANDPVALRSFIAVYRSGADVDDVKHQLQALEPRRMWLSGPLGIGVLTLLLLMIASGALFWFEKRPASPPEPQLPEIAAPAPAAPPPSLAIASPQPDQVAWELLKDTTDEAALKQFVEQYPNSPLRKDAEARIASLEATGVKKPAPEPDQIAWAIVRDGKDPDQLRRFIAQFPNSSLSADAERRLAVVLAEAAKAAPDSAIDPADLARLLQLELIRVGCFSGQVNGKFDATTDGAWKSFAKLTSNTTVDEVSPDALKAVRAVNTRVCPLRCQGGQHAEGDQCVADPPAKNVVAAPAHPQSHSTPGPTPRATGKCFTFQGRQFCE